MAPQRSPASQAAELGLTQWQQERELKQDAVGAAMRAELAAGDAADEVSSEMQAQRGSGLGVGLGLSSERYTLNGDGGGGGSLAAAVARTGPGVGGGLGGSMGLGLAGAVDSLDDLADRILAEEIRHVFDEAKQGLAFIVMVRLVLCSLLIAVCVLSRFAEVLSMLQANAFLRFRSSRHYKVRSDACSVRALMLLMLLKQDLVQTYQPSNQTAGWTPNSLVR